MILRDLVQVSANNHVRSPIEPARDKLRETLPVTTRKLFEGHDRYDCIRVGCHEADERFKIELGKEGQTSSLGKKGNLTSRKPSPIPWW